MKRMPGVAFGVFLFLGLANFSMPAFAGLTSTTINWQYFYNGGARSASGSAGSFTVNGGIGGTYAPADQGSKAVFNVDASDDSVTFDYTPDAFGQNNWATSMLSLSPTIYNGIALNFPTITITSVRINPATNMAGFTLARVSYTSNQIQVDWQGLAFSPTTIVKLDVNKAIIVAHPSGDFDQNGTPDLVWQNTATGQVAVNYYGGSGGATLESWAYLNATGLAGWHVMAVADFDRNGVPDLVWQNDTTRKVMVTYYGGVKGADYQSRWAWLDPTGVPGWHVVGAADFNGDGIPDLVFQNDTTRQLTVYYFGGADGSILQSWNWLDKNGTAGWHVAAVADFNGDGVPDVVWENDATHQVTVYYYGGTGGATFQRWNWLSEKAISGWHVAGTRDFNADGVPDLIWQQDSTTFVTVYYMGGNGGATIQGWNWLNAQGAPGWTVVK